MLSTTSPAAAPWGSNRSVPSRWPTRTVAGPHRLTPRGTVDGQLRLGGDVELELDRVRVEHDGEVGPASSMLRGVIFTVTSPATSSRCGSAVAPGPSSLPQAMSPSVTSPIARTAVKRCTTPLHGRVG